MQIKDLSEKEFDQLRRAIERIEGWEAGDENSIDKWYISGVHKEHGIIVEYLVKKGNKASWMTKKEAVNLAAEGRLHATIVHLKNGTVYLRPEHGTPPFKEVA